MTQLFNDARTSAHTAMSIWGATEDEEAKLSNSLGTRSDVMESLCWVDSGVGNGLFEGVAANLLGRSYDPLYHL